MLGKRIERLVLSTLIAAALLVLMVAPSAVSDTPTASVYGQVVLNGQPVNGATVSCNGTTATTSTSIYQGFYAFQLAIGQDYPITATYTANNVTYTASDNVDLRSLTSAPAQPVGLSALNLVAVATPTPTPTVTPTPTPNPNATATPTPTATPTATPTPTPTVTPTPTPTPVPQQQNNVNTHPVVTPTPTPTPTPSPTAQVDLSQLNTSSTPRKVFSAPKWSVDQERVTVTNDGNNPITVKAWVGDPSNNVTTTVDAGATKVISTAPVLTQENQLMNVGFDAYENGVPIDSYKATFTVSSPTPIPTTQSPGFAAILALVALLGAAAYLAVKKER